MNSFHSCSHLSYASLYVWGLILFRLTRQCKSTPHVFKTEQGVNSVFSSLVINVKMSHYKYVIGIHFFHLSLGLISCILTEMSQMSVEVLQGGKEDPKSS